jgi:hypothetical protein
VVFVACWAALEMLAHARDLLVGVSVGELELDVAVELVEAPLARQLGPRRSEEPGEEKALIGGSRRGCPPVGQRRGQDASRHPFQRGRD